ncbi:hypothetical protein RND81_02G139000 [Saponaria officinalis]|uniref:Xylanase inhibitor C-terminal domain-containing protein n=1 Tax=Saponaria officinalis TaxID=3572 RepID=A0AAW1MUD0_SAPOF
MSIMVVLLLYFGLVFFVFRIVLVYQTLDWSDFDKSICNSPSCSIIHPVFDRGILVLGSTVEPGIVYTPLVPSQYITDIFRCMPHYNFNLESITINNQKLAIDASVFTTSTSTGTIIDSGPTLAYLAKAAYDPFVNAISAAVSQSVRPLLSRGNSCFLITSSALNNQTLMNVVIMS